MDSPTVTRALSADYCDRVFSYDDGEPAWSLVSFVELHDGEPDLDAELEMLMALAVGDRRTVWGGNEVTRRE